ncbi:MULTISPECIES: mycofactocin biosynthesis chaperone MftB [Saccharopolyspora]|uniref:Mycofactocin biosynthesis chaperone MftB n=1 Tax=Saccharopolyspora cebuensis TaxID=418759 RepID=A0ABV4CPZ3_9PSEU
MTAFDTGSGYRLSPDVALRPEPFGALAYHFGNRRLSFLKVPELVDLVRGLGEHPSVDAALETVPPERRGAFRRALASLADSGLIVPVRDGPKESR